MIDAEVETKHHSTGHRWLDMLLGTCAILISLISLFIAVRHGTTMERLVEASTWPDISFSTGNGDASEPVIDLTLKNTGVGPARIEEFEVFYDGQPMPSLLSLFKKCCELKIPATKMSYGYNVVTDEVLPARETIRFLSFPAANNSTELWNLLNTERFKIAVRVCYCSVFDECYRRDSRARKPDRVASCPVPQTPFTP